MPEVPTPAALPTSRPAAPTSSVKETIESILVAFILAFVFRAFVVEAFVIPTGSMATTLLGAHMRFQCPDCGYGFNVNWSPDRGTPEADVSPPDYNGPIGHKIYCPNCGYEMPSASADRLPIYYGDRILVLKYLYLLHSPERFDVVVFKAPPNTAQNYIKRLIGRPGEAVMILDGDVYIRPPNSPDPTAFVVQPKPPLAQQAMWRLVNDNDYVPRKQDRADVPWHEPWKSDGSAWTQDERERGRVFHFDAATRAKLTYDASANLASQTTSDYTVFNQYGGGVQPRSPTPSYLGSTDIAVSDLDLRLTYERSGGTGPLDVGLTKRSHTFTAELTPGAATLFDEVGGVRRQVGKPYPLPSGARPVRVELSNADYQVTLRIDGDIVAQTTPADYAPDLKALLREYEDSKPAPMPSASISAEGQQCRVSHVSLWRDVYYYNDKGGRDVLWATPEAFPKHAQQLGPDEYFVMGDNSQLSFDARCWPMRVDLPAEGLDVGAGRVPGRFLLGRAFYVYWPAGYRAVGGLPALVPNFGSMRVVH